MFRQVFWVAFVENYLHVCEYRALNRDKSRFGFSFSAKEEGSMRITCELNDVEMSQALAILKGELSANIPFRKQNLLQSF